MGLLCKLYEHWFLLCVSIPLSILISLLMNCEMLAGVRLHVHSLIWTWCSAWQQLACRVCVQCTIAIVSCCQPLLLAMWFCLTRLETRTKESNRCASSGVCTPCSLMNVFAGICAPAADWLTDRGLSLSISIRTRKMVNYACTERIQRKLWWRFVLILTCKSFVILGYRGERLIEPSSSWFLPKFPSG